jgi:hypothetical protein
LILFFLFCGSGSATASGGQMMGQRYLDASSGNFEVEEFTMPNGIKLSERIREFHISPRDSQSSPVHCGPSISYVNVMAFVDDSGVGDDNCSFCTIFAFVGNWLEEHGVCVKREFIRRVHVIEYLEIIPAPKINSVRLSGIDPSTRNIPMVASLFGGGIYIDPHFWREFGFSDIGIGLHLVQLALHDGQLPSKDHGGNDTYHHKRGGEDAYSPRPARHYQIAVGFLLLGAATATVFVAFKGAEYADYRWPAFWWAPLLGGIAIAFWLADHALGYLLG